MGWTYQTATHYKKGKIDRKAECDQLFNQPMVSLSCADHIGKYEVLKSAMVGSTYYAAVKKTKYATESEPEEVNVFAVIVLTNVKSDKYCNFGYKDMSESMGPYKYDCPKGILDLLDPTDNEYALEWRKKCREKLVQKKSPDALNNLPIGSKIKYIRFDGTEVVAYKHPAAYQFKRPFWMLEGNTGYVSANHIPENYIVIKRGE